MKTTRILLILCCAACMNACDVNSVRTGQDSHNSNTGAPSGDAGTGLPPTGDASNPRTPTAGERGSGSSAR